MSKYVFVYHGGTMPETAEEGQRVMAAWQAWLDGLGDAVIDGGNPVGMSSTVHSDGSVSDDGGSNPMSGYGLFTAGSSDEAIEMARRCPVLEAGGSVEVAMAIDM